MGVAIRPLQSKVNAEIKYGQFKFDPFEAESHKTSIDNSIKVIVSLNDLITNKLDQCLDTIDNEELKNNINSCKSQMANINSNLTDCITKLNTELENAKNDVNKNQQLTDEALGEFYE